MSRATFILLAARLASSALAANVSRAEGVVTANTARLLVIKHANSGSSWFAILLNAWPRTFVCEESITQFYIGIPTEAIKRQVVASLTEPTNRLPTIGHENGAALRSARRVPNYVPRKKPSNWSSYVPSRASFECDGCELAVVGLTVNPVSIVPPGLHAHAKALFPKAAPPFKTIVYIRTNVVKFAFSSSGSNNHSPFDAAKAKAREVTCTDFAFNVAKRIAWVGGLRRLAEARRSPDVLLLTYEQLQSDTQATMASLAKWLGVDLPPRRRLGLKRSSDDLRLTVANFGEVESWLAPGGILESQCLLRMLRSATPEVFDECVGPPSLAYYLSQPHKRHQGTNCSAPAARVGAVEATNCTKRRRNGASSRACRR